MKYLTTLPNKWHSLPNPSEQRFLRPTINFKSHLIPEIRKLFKMVGLLFRMFKGDRVRIRGILLGEMVQQEMGVHRIELGMPMQAKENRSRNFLDEEKLLFLAGEQGNTFDADVDNQPVQDLALNEDNIFQADECDAFDSDVDDEPTAQ
ncbi:hypothetical protein Tco_1366617, partial [Tanacetum coccineum]